MVHFLFFWVCVAGVLGHSLSLVIIMLKGGTKRPSLLKQNNPQSTCLEKNGRLEDKKTVRRIKKVEGFGYCETKDGYHRAENQWKIE